MNTDFNILECSPPGFFKRITAIVYDVLLVFSLLMLVTAIFIGIKVAIFGTAAQPGEAIRVIEGPVEKALLFILNISTLFSFYAYFWARHQCSLGMQAWRMRIINQHGEAPSLKQAFIRFIGVFISLIPFGLGYLWIFIDKQNRTWHDHLSGTWLVILPKDQSNTLLRKKSK